MHTRAQPTNSIQSLARVGNTEIFEPPKKIGKQTERERQREVLCLLRMRKSSREKRRTEREEEEEEEEEEERREDEAVVKATVLL